jgi:hypothetical protein
VPEATQEERKKVTRSMTATSTTSHLPVLTDQQAPQRSQQTNNPQENVDGTKEPQTQSTAAQLKAQNAPPSMQTQSSTLGTAKAANIHFTQMENKDIKR